MHSVTDRRTDRQTDRQTDGQQAAGNSRSYCVAVRSANKIIVVIVYEIAVKIIYRMHHVKSLTHNTVITKL